MPELRMRRLLRLASSLGLLASSLWAAPALAQTPGSCETGTAQAVLDESGVQASLFNTGGLFFGGTTTSGNGYIVPKETGNSPIFAATVWIGGKVGGEVRASFARYGRYRMWPGPLDEGATLPDPDDCSPYDRFWTLTVLDVLGYEQTGEASANLTEWPVGLGAPAVDANGQPVVVTSRDQTINLAAGERPVISGTQMVFWVMNDVGNAHVKSREGEVDSAPLGVEVAVTASAIVSDEDAFHQGTFYRYTVTNRNARPITDAFLGFWVDADLGDAGDDYVGVDTTRGMGFVYNNKDEDAVYGQAPPAIGFDLLGGLSSAPLSLKGFRFSTVSTSEDTYNQLRGLWIDGSPLRMKGFGYQTDGPITRWGYPGDPVTESFWSEVNNDGEGQDSPLGDRRFVVVAPGFELQPGAAETFELAVLFGQGADRLDSITQLRAASDRVQAAYEDGTLFAPRVTPLLATPQANAPAGDDRVLRDGELFFEWTEVPDAERYQIELSRSPDFADAQEVLVEGGRGLVTISDALVGRQPAPIYWRIRAETRTRRSLYSPTQSFQYYRFVPGTLTLADGRPGIVEVVGPGGTDPCETSDPAPVGCDEVGGRFVLGVPNSTGAFAVGEEYARDYRSLSERARQPENDFEIRFVGSSYAYSQTDRLGLQPGEVESVRRLHKVPFQLWDLGPTSSTGFNDPEDDVRLIPVLRDFLVGSIGDEVCEFAYAARARRNPPRDGFDDEVRATKQIAGVYPSSTYQAFAEFASSQTERSPVACAAVPRNVDSFLGAAPFEDLYFVDTTPGEDGTTADLAGAVIRIYTNTPFVEGAPEPQLDDSAVGAPYPNPASGLVQIPYRLGATADVELAVFDVLGRKVVQLREGRQPRGDLQTSFDARGVAPGVYIVRLRAGDVVRSARLTVVR